MPFVAWTGEHGRLPKELGEAHGRYRVSRTPYMRGIQEAMADPTLPDIVVMKSAQVGWTVGGIILFVMWAVDMMLGNIIVMFPRNKSAQDFVQEKFNPTVRGTPRVKDKIPTNTMAKDGNKELFRKFPGGWLKFVGSHSISDSKSSSAPIVIWEEPDDADTDVKGQGGAIRLLVERTKTFSWVKRLIGGTPTIHELSAVEHAYNQSDKRMFFVPCHQCGEAHVLDFDHIHWEEEADIEHEVYGRAMPETAYYACPHCDARWDDWDKRNNVERAEEAGAGWKATAPWTGVAGFWISELYSSFPGSIMAALVRKYLNAKYKEAQGDLTDMVAFFNNQLGRAFVYQGDAATAATLRERVEDYPEMVVPMGAWRVTIGVDCQKDRLAIVIRAWGPGEESWLLFWGELYALNTTADRADPVWSDLDHLVFGPIPHTCGATLYADALSIDASDGNTSDAVYAWVRERQYHRTNVRAIKGASEWASRTSDREIYTTPKRVDHRSDTKASKYGLKVYQVGTNRAKDLITGRRKLTGHGPGRMHTYKGVRDDYHDQVTAEVKAPDRRAGGKMTYQKKAGAANEAGDCDVYSLHAARAERIHTMRPEQWQALEAAVMQADLFRATGTDGPAPPPREAPRPAPAATPAPAAPRPAAVPPPRTTIAEGL